jgi:small subunit ribosomal protein S16
MLKIRLKRLGAKKTPTYRIIVINSTTKREGKPVQELGHYNPKTKVMKLDKETALDWVKKGAQPTETVKYLIDNCNADGSLNYKEKTEKKLSKKAIVKLEAEKEAKAKAEAEAKEAAKAAAEAPVAEEPVAEVAEEVTEEVASVAEKTEEIAE